MIGPIAFGPSQQAGSEQLGGAMPMAMNVVIDKAGVVHRRPGVQAYSGAPATVVDADGITGLVETQGGNLYAIGGHPTQKPIYQVTGGGFVDVSATTGYKLQGAFRPVIAETEAMLAMTAGDVPLKLQFSTGLTSALGGTPPTATHVVANSSRLLVNSYPNDRGVIYYSGLAAGTSISGHETWSGLTSGFFSAEARPDPISALWENTSEVFAFGRTSLQYFSPDSTTVYAPVTTTEHGCAALYSIVKVDQSFAWLDHQRRFVMSDGRKLEVIGELRHILEAPVDDVSTCYGYRVHVGYVECLVWTFPEDGRTVAFQIGGGWSQWAGYENNAPKPMTILSHFQKPGTDDNIVGLTTGRIAALETGAVDDLGEPIFASATTGFIDRGTPARKQCVCVRLTFKRGESATYPGPSGSLYWRDDLGGWSSGLPVYFGSSGESTPVLEFRSLGVYRRRQWKFEFSGLVDFALVSAVEEFNVLAV